MGHDNGLRSEEDAGAARLLAVAVLAQLGEFAALFVQQIVASVPGETDPGVIQWEKEPLGNRPRG